MLSSVRSAPCFPMMCLRRWCSLRASYEQKGQAKGRSSVCILACSRNLDAKRKFLPQKLQVRLADGEHKAVGGMRRSSIAGVEVLT